MFCYISFVNRAPCPWRKSEQSSRLQPRTGTDYFITFCLHAILQSDNGCEYLRKKPIKIQSYRHSKDSQNPKVDKQKQSQKGLVGFQKLHLFWVPMNPQIAWKVVLKTASFIGIQIYEKTVWCILGGHLSSFTGQNFDHIHEKFAVQLLFLAKKLKSRGHFLFGFF